MHMQIPLPEINAGLIDEESRHLLEEGGFPEKVREWIKAADSQYSRLYRTLRQQNIEHMTLFEIISEIAARSLSTDLLMSYFVRMIRGQFATGKVLIYRREPRAGLGFRVLVSDGLSAPDMEFSDPDPVVAEMAQVSQPALLQDLPASVRESEIVRKLEETGVYLFTPLWAAKHVGSKGLQGFLFVGPKLANLAYTDRELNFFTMISQMLAIAFQNESLFRLSSVDSLTNVMSRGHFEAMFSEACDDIVDETRRCAMIMIDLDKFKLVNDTYGHPAGDHVLRSVAAELKRQVRPGDMVCRYGGEEFTIFLKNADSRVAMQVAERIQGQIRNLEVHYHGQTISVTISQGVACWPEHCSDQRLLYEKADQALYRAKEKRNRIVLA